MKQGAVLKTNRGQAINLPETIALPENVKRVDVVAIGRARILTPAGETWDTWFEDIGVTTDFMAVREQPVDQSRNDQMPLKTDFDGTFLDGLR